MTQCCYSKLTFLPDTRSTRVTHTPRHCQHQGCLRAHHRLELACLFTCLMSVSPSNGSWEEWQGLPRPRLCPECPEYFWDLVDAHQYLLNEYYEWDHPR